MEESSVNWRKASYSSANGGACVEVAARPAARPGASARHDGPAGAGPGGKRGSLGEVHGQPEVGQPRG